MNTSQTSFLSEMKSGKPLPVSKMAYFRQRLRNRLYELVLGEFIRQSKENGLTKTELTHRIRRTNKSIVSRWLASPSNLTIDTISDLLLAMGTEPSEFSIQKLGSAPPRNDQGDSLLDKDSFAWVEQSQREGLESASKINSLAISAGLSGKGPKNGSYGNTQQSMHSNLLSSN